LAFHFSFNLHFAMRRNFFARIFAFAEIAVKVMDWQKGQNYAINEALGSKMILNDTE